MAGRNSLGGAGVLRYMPDVIVKRMRDRARELRRIADMAHDSSMSEMLLTMANQMEADADRLEARDETLH